MAPWGHPAFLEKLQDSQFASAVPVLCHDRLSHSVCFGRILGSFRVAVSVAVFKLAVFVAVFAGEEVRIDQCSKQLYSSPGRFASHAFGVASSPAVV